MQPGKKSKKMASHFCNFSSEKKNVWDDFHPFFKVYSAERDTTRL